MRACRLRTAMISCLERCRRSTARCDSSNNGPKHSTREEQSECLYPIKSLMQST